MELAQYISGYFSLLSKMLTTFLWLCFAITGLLVIACSLARYWIKQRSRSLLPHLRQTEKAVVVGFFHPYCNAGGGGERVLWVAIRALQNQYADVKCVVYTGDIDATGSEILAKAQQRFNITLPKPVEFIFLKRRKWVEAKMYPMFTLLGQSFGSVILGWEALMSYVPDVFIDSMGYAFTLPLFKHFGGCSVGCYVHYPTISTDMLQRVSEREENFNNPSFVSRSSFLTSIKIVYYRMFAYTYGVAGSRSDFVMVNSTWTYGHIKSLWGVGDRTVIVYPPCDVSEFIKIPVDKSEKKFLTILSIAQFRPEKHHALQICSFHKFLQKVSEKERSRYKLVLVGGCRDSQDRQLVEGLRQLAENLDIQESVDVEVNVSFDRLKQLMGEAVIGLHTMRDEHFGIGVVEMMAAGIVTLAHNSGGPKLDIVRPDHANRTGYLASDEQTYTDAMETIFSLTEAERHQIGENARESVYRFSDEEFKSGFLAVVEPVLRGSVK